MFVRFVVHTNRCFCDAFASANIWLYHVLHDNLHCLVFKEHPWFSLEAFEKLFRESASIWYLSAFALSRTFLKFFFRSSHASLVSSLSAVLCSRCLPPTCIILHVFGCDVNTFLKFFFAPAEIAILFIVLPCRGLPTSRHKWPLGAKAPSVYLSPCPSGPPPSGRGADI